MLFCFSYLEGDTTTWLWRLQSNEKNTCTAHKARCSLPLSPDIEPVLRGDLDTPRSPAPSSQGSDGETRIPTATSFLGECLIRTTSGSVMVSPISQDQMRSRHRKRVRCWTNVWSMSQDLINDREVVVSQINSGLKLQRCVLQVSRVPWLVAYLQVLLSINPQAWPPQTLDPPLPLREQWVTAVSSSRSMRSRKHGRQPYPEPRQTGFLKFVSLHHAIGWRTKSKYPFSLAWRNLGRSGQPTKKQTAGVSAPYQLQQKVKWDSNHKEREEKERSHKHFQRRDFPNVKCTDNLMEFT